MTDFLGYKVNVDFSPDEIFALTTHEDGRGNTHVIAEHVMKLRDKAIREALIALGWTPPPERELDPSNKSA